MRPMAPDGSLTTRQTVLSRLRNLEDQESWRTFFDRYWELLYNVARRSGLGEPEARMSCRRPSSPCRKRCLTFVTTTPNSPLKNSAE